MSETADLITVEVAYALPDRQKIIELQVEPGTTAKQAVVQSGIADEFPEIDMDNDPMGVFAQVLGTKGLPPADQYRLQPGDRVEIYRPLIADPKEVRKQRAEARKRESGK